MQDKQAIMKNISQIIIEISSEQRKDFQEENIILELCCKFPDAEPLTIAKLYNGIVKDADKTGNDIIRLFRICRLDRITERIELFKRSGFNAQQILKAINQSDSSLIESVRSETDCHVQAKRLTLLALASVFKSELTDDAYRYLIRMNRDFSNECLDAILDLIERQISVRKKEDQRTHLTPEAYEEEIYRLTLALNRANNLVNRQQDNYEEKIIKMRTDESIRMISMLNSEKYGCILVLLISAQDGVRNLQKKA